MSVVREQRAAHLKRSKASLSIQVGNGDAHGQFNQVLPDQVRSQEPQQIVVKRHSKPISTNFVGLGDEPEPVRAEAQEYQMGGAHHQGVNGAGRVGTESTVN